MKCSMIYENAKYYKPLVIYIIGRYVPYATAFKKIITLTLFNIYSIGGALKPTPQKEYRI